MNKVFLITGAVPPQTGGELYNYKLVRYLETAGFEIECISLHKKLATKLAKLPIIGNILAAFVVYCLLSRCQGILVEDHFLTQYLWLLNIIQRVVRQQKIIILVHSLYGYDTSDRILIRKWFHGIKHKLRLSFANEIITNSEYAKQEIVSLGITPSIIQVLPPGVDRGKLKIIPQDSNHEKYQILCVANYLPGKGLIYLIEAFSQVNRREFTLHLAGNPHKSSAYYKQMVKMVHELNLTKDVFFHNGADKETIQQLYSNANIFVLPTLKETFGIVLIEAMHYSLPIITTNVAAIPELVTNNENGFLIPPKNSQTLAIALSKLIENSELRIEMAKKGHQRVANSYNWEQTCYKFLSIVQNVDNIT
ncbi:MAG: glycosyltransferase family 4 protein [Cyanomargarita calcarea GSE-NOS-MK-12-04C]|jgi:glycosyltransferase involved in cell wall biosynthesis|uniref:Glycosyltransferase family 4 protein n=1 Tax=Cyanomargarita calcarea GSE-NOS-MK-12-04C TaxID=2839659 RepID=A0A951QLN8_9CYAN|nr:glycosyltransferase family 4 protein [Cyanomargarita calcarea GSE-NOS-MK-12-04C]